ncbi:hypothetical protein DFJ77DRAFT_9817 [Powellomyces hirtus]|nr:hypothetical protein DFJ77DRAFT_9817 [Powellomyces hirtus]
MEPKAPTVQPRQTLPRRPSNTTKILAKPQNHASALLKVLGELMLDWAIVPFLNGFLFGALNTVARRMWDARRFNSGQESQRRQVHTDHDNRDSGQLPVDSFQTQTPRRLILSKSWQTLAPRRHVVVLSTHIENQVCRYPAEVDIDPLIFLNENYCNSLNRRL